LHGAKRAAALAHDFRPSHPQWFPCHMPEI
jgi:hypothetical protein